MTDAPRASIAEEVYDFLVSQPTPEAILAFAPSEALQARYQELATLNNQGTISETQRDELDEFVRLFHVLSQVRARAYKRLHG